MEIIVKNTIELYDLCPKNSHITLGVSGGADSIAMLHFFDTHKKAYCLTLQAVHIHHGIRGEEADQDATFVASFCQERNIPCQIFYVDVMTRAKKEKKSIEEMGRIVRYETFKKVAKGGKVAVAHNEDDQAETVLMHLARGSGLRGLCGMKVQNDTIIRPLLFASRKKIEQYCTEHRLPYCTDSTNKNSDYSRNRMRLELLPLLSDIYDNAVQSRIVRTAEIIKQEDDFLNIATEELYEKAKIDVSENKLSFQLELLRKSHKALLPRFYFQALQTLGIKTNISSQHIDMISDIVHDTKMKELHLPNNIFIKTSYSTLIFQKGNAKTDDFHYHLSFSENTFIKEHSFYVEISILNVENNEIISDDYTKVFDYDKINETICCRNRKIGDTIGIHRNKNTKDIAQKSLKKDFIDRKIPKEARDHIPLIACGNDVLWAIGIATSSQYEVTTNTTQRLQIKLRRIIDERAN